MTVVVGHSAALRYVMDEALNTEIQRGLWWFLGSLFGGVAIFFVGFSIFFERQLQNRVAKPIMDLANKIKNPKEFMASRSKANDIYNA